MEIPEEARQAVALAMDFLRTHQLGIGEIVSCNRLEIGPDFYANLLSRLPARIRERAEGIMTTIPAEMRQRSHWQLVLHDPGRRAIDDPCIATWLKIFDDGTVDLQLRLRVETVYLFVSAGRFQSLGDLRAYIYPTYTENGEMLPSSFMREVRLSAYDPGNIEAFWSDHPDSAYKLLGGGSYADTWIGRLNNLECDSQLVDAAICVFFPNRIDNPQGCSMRYLGAFEYFLPLKDLS